MILVNKRGGSVGICINKGKKTLKRIMLQPGENELSDEQLAQLESSDYFHSFVEAGHIVPKATEVFKRNKPKKAKKHVNIEESIPTEEAQGSTNKEEVEPETEAEEVEK